MLSSVALDSGPDHPFLPDTFILLYNLVFTSLPVIVLGAFDQDVHGDALLAFPALYERGIHGLEYTRTKFWLYVLDGQGFIIVSRWVRLR